MTIGVNDYPFRGGCPGSCSNQCGFAGQSFACCQCTSFALWRMVNDLKVAMGPGYRNANTWPDAARVQLGSARVNHTPAVGSICALPLISADGHVAFTLAVGPTTAYGISVPAGHVLLEDYNFCTCGDCGVCGCAYHHHVMPVSTSGAGITWFLHYHDIVPVPVPTPHPVPVPVPVPTPHPPPPVSPPLPFGELLGPSLLVAGAVGLGWYALKRNPALSRRVEDDAGKWIRRARGSSSGSFRRRGDDDDGWESAYNNAAERLFNKRDGDTVTAEEDEAICAEARAELAAQR